MASSDLQLWESAPWRDLRYEAPTNSNGIHPMGKPASVITNHSDVPCFLLDDPANELLLPAASGVGRVLTSELPQITLGASLTEG